MAMELQYLNVFYEVAKRGSISAAAKALRVTQPSVSRGIQKLENSIGLKVFIRQPRGVFLTEDGQRVYESCHRIFRECEAIEKSPIARNYPVRIAASENLCIHIIPQLLAKNMKIDGLVNVELMSGTSEEVIKAVLNDEVDVGYCYHPAKVPGLVCLAITTVEFWLIAQPKKLGGRPSIRALKDQPFIGSLSRNYLGPYAAKTLLAEAGLDGSETQYQSNSQEAQLSMVIAGLGFSLVPWFIATSEIKRGNLAKIPTVRPLRAPLYKLSRLSAPRSRYEELETSLRELLKAPK